MYCFILRSFILDSTFLLFGFSFGSFFITDVSYDISRQIKNLEKATGLGFHEDINSLTDILKKSLCPAHLIEKIINRYITGTQNNHHPRDSLPTTSPTFYFKLPYIGHFSAITQKRSAILLSAIAMTWISNWFSLPSKSVTCLV